MQKTFEVTSNDTLIAIPLFLFMGYLVERANILDRLFYSLQISMSNVPGALAVATMITCAMFATATGIVGAVVTLMGLLALPAMLRAGYDIKLSTGVVCAGGCLGILDSAQHLADRLRGDRRRVRGQALCRRLLSRVSARRTLHASTLSPGRSSIRRSLPSCPRSRPTCRYGQVMMALATSFLPLAAF